MPASQAARTPVAESSNTRHSRTSSTHPTDRNLSNASRYGIGSGLSRSTWSPQMTNRMCSETPQRSRIGTTSGIALDDTTPKGTRAWLPRIQARTHGSTDSSTTAPPTIDSVLPGPPQIQSLSSRLQPGQIQKELASATVADSHQLALVPLPADRDAPRLDRFQPRLVVQVLAVYERAVEVK